MVRLVTLVISKRSGLSSEISLKTMVEDVSPGVEALRAREPCSARACRPLESRAVMRTGKGNPANAAAGA